MMTKNPGDLLGWCGVLGNYLILATVWIWFDWAGVFGFFVVGLTVGYWDRRG